MHLYIRLDHQGNSSLTKVGVTQFLIPKNHKLYK